MILLWNLKKQARCRKLRLLATACEDLWRGTLSQWATARSEIQKCPAKPDQALQLYFWMHLSSCILYSWMHMSYNTYTDLAGHLQVERGGPGWKSQIFAMTCRCCRKHLKQDRSRVEREELTWIAGILLLKFFRHVFWTAWCLACLLIGSGPDSWWDWGSCPASGSRCEQSLWCAWPWRMCSNRTRTCTNMLNSSESAIVILVWSICYIVIDIMYKNIPATSNFNHESCLRWLCFQRFVAFNIRW